MHIRSVIAFLSIAACSSSSEEPHCQPEGNFSYQLTATNRGCPGAMDESPNSLQIQTDGDNFVVFLPGIPGGCPGTLKSCSTTFSCELIGIKGGVIEDNQLSITFDDHGFSGSLTTTLLPPMVRTACIDEFTIKGTRK